MEKPQDSRAEQMRQRLAAKAAGREAKGKGGPLLAFLPPPKTELAPLGGKSVAWLLGLMTALALAWAMLAGSVGPVLALATGEAAYFANFSRSDLPFQVRLTFLILAVLGALTPLRTLIFAQLLAACVLELGMGYGILERMLYCMPPNRPDNPEPFSLDLLVRVAKEPVRSPPQPFAVKPGASRPGVGSDGFEYATSRAARRKK